MSKLKLGVEGDTVDMLEASTTVRIEPEFETLIDSPFSPLGGRVLETAVDDCESLEKMNCVLEKSDIEGLSETNKDMITVSMESIRSRLLGGVSKGVAVESISTKKQLQIAIEDNKNILQRAWEAIKKFFKGIYDWVTSFFKSKETTLNGVEKRLKESDKVLEDSFKAGLSNIDNFIKTFKEETSLKLNNAFVELSDGTVIGRTRVAAEDVGTDYNKLVGMVKDVLLGKEPIILITQYYNALLGDNDVSLKDGWFKEFQKTKDKSEALFIKALKESGLENFADKTTNKEVVSAVTTKTISELVGEQLVLAEGTQIKLDGNNVSLSKTAAKEIRVEFFGGARNVKAILSDMQSIVKEAKQSNKECFEFTASMSNKVFDFGKTLEKDATESEEIVNILKTKLQFINSFIKLIVLLINQSFNLSRLVADLTETYIAAMSLLVSQAKKASQA